jgi:hypothetical protein
MQNAMFYSLTLCVCVCVCVCEILDRSLCWVAVFTTPTQKQWYKNTKTKKYYVLTGLNREKLRTLFSHKDVFRALIFKYLLTSATLRSSLFWDVTHCRSTFRENLSVFKGQAANMELIGCHETSVTYCQYTLSNIPEERRSHLHRGGNLSHRSTTFIPLDLSDSDPLPLWL